MHHRFHTIKDVENRRDACWNKIVADKIVIPAHSIKLYDADGNKTGRLLYSDHTVTPECISVDPVGTSTVAFPEAEAFESLETTETPATPTSETVVNAPSMEHADNETSTASTCAAEALCMEHADNETLLTRAAEALCMEHAPLLPMHVQLMWKRLPLLSLLMTLMIYAPSM